MAVRHKVQVFVLGYMFEAVGDTSPSGMKAHTSRLSLFKEEYLELPKSAEGELKMMATGSIQLENGRNRETGTK